MTTKINMTTRKMRSEETPTLRFSPTAWAKLLFLRDYGPTEVGGFATSRPDDPFAIDDVRLVRQVCTSVSVAFDDEAVANYFDDQVDAGLRPNRFARIWVHTHPGNSAAPSQVDETTFDRVFGAADWAVMFILASQGQTYARLRFNVGPQGSLQVPVEVDYRSPFPASDQAAWQKEYLANVQVPAMPFGACADLRGGPRVDAFGQALVGQNDLHWFDDAEWHAWRRGMDDVYNLEEQPPW